MLDDLRGAFVLVAWNRADRAGVVAVDQLGVRSLYFADTGGTLSFSTEIHTLLGLLPRRPAPAPIAVIHRISSSSPPGDMTLYEGVRRLGGGHWFDLNGQWTKRRYWAPRYQPPEERTLSECADEISDAVASAVRRRMRPGERLGIIMSGGVDSAAVASAAARSAEEGSARPCGYSTVFPNEPDLDESERIDLLTTHLGLPSVQIEPEPVGAIWLSLDYLRRFGLPLAGSGYVIEYPLLQRAAADGVDVVIDGQGGDEVFGSAPYLLADLVRRLRFVASIQTARRYPRARNRPPWNRQLLRFWATTGLQGALPYRVHQVIRRRRGAERFAPAWLSPRSAQELLDTSDPWAWKQDGGTPLWWRCRSYLLTTSREEVGISEYLRHRAATSGLEARPPLLDVELVELALSIPPRLGFDPYLDRGIVRASMKGDVPDPVRLSTKKSNLSPFYHRILAGADLNPLRRLLTDNDLALGPYVDRAQVARLVTEPPAIGEAGWAEWVGQVWNLATTESWLRSEADSATLDELAGDPDLKPPSWRIHREPSERPGPAATGSGSWR